MNQQLRPPRRLLPLSIVAVLAILLTLLPPSGLAQQCALGTQDQTLECVGSTESQTPIPVVVAVGDIACSIDDPAFNDGLGTPDSCRQNATAAMALSAQPQAVLLLGDLQYPVGALDQFRVSFNQSWGALLPITHPAPGNHEYETKGASGYFDYFGSQAGDRERGYYSLDIGAWHIVALNSNCARIGGCRESSPQGLWLKNDLTSTDQACTLAYWHHPRFSSSEHRSDSNLAPFWRILHAAGAELVLNGHDHVYERFAPQRPDGELDPDYGLVQLTVGTGGRSLYSFDTPRANSLVRLSRFGILRLELRPTSAAWRFLAADGGDELDSGRISCHDAPPIPARP